MYAELMENSFIATAGSATAWTGAKVAI